MLKSNATILKEKSEKEKKNFYEEMVNVYLQALGLNHYKTSCISSLNQTLKTDHSCL